MKTKAIRFGAVFLGLILILAAVRIAYVNITAVKPQTEYYKVNEWVELNGSFFRDSSESTDGYSVKVTDLELISKEDYMAKYKLENSSISTQDSFNYILELTVSILNDNNEIGKVMIGDWMLVGKNSDFVTVMDPQLLMDTDDRIDDYLSSVTTVAGKEISLKLAFPMIGMKTKEEINKNAVYKLAVTKYPVRKYIRLEA